MTRPRSRRGRAGRASMSACSPATGRRGWRSSMSTCCTTRPPPRFRRCCDASWTAGRVHLARRAGAEVPDPGAGHRARQPRSRSTVVEIDGQKHMVEVLGAGQQAVVAGIHPKTGRSYVWPVGGLEETEPSKLPLVTPAELADILAACSKILLRYGAAIGRKGRSVSSAVQCPAQGPERAARQGQGAGPVRRRVRGQQRLDL